MNDQKFIIVMRYPQPGYLQHFDSTKNIITTVVSEREARVFCSISDAEKELMILNFVFGVGVGFIKEKQS